MTVLSFLPKTPPQLVASPTACRDTHKPPTPTWSDSSSRNARARTCSATLPSVKAQSPKKRTQRCLAFDQSFVDHQAPIVPTRHNPATFSDSDDDWIEYARNLDIRSHQQAQQESAMHRAVVIEDYQKAAELKAELRDLQRNNLLSTVQLQQSDAVSKGDYKVAASLRDDSLQNLTGWWAADNHGSDPWCHVIRVTEGHSRLEARAYSPTHLADVAGWGPDSPYHRPYGNKSYSEVGIPIFEVLLKRDQEGVPAGNIRQKPFVTPDHLAADDTLGQSIAGVGASPASAQEAEPPTEAQAAHEESCTPTTSGLTTSQTPFWQMLNRKTNFLSHLPDIAARFIQAPPPPQLPRKRQVTSGQHVADKGQLMPRRNAGPSPSLREAFEKLEELDAMSAMNELEERTSTSAHSARSPPAVIRTRLPCDVTFSDRNHFRLDTPALHPGGTPRCIHYKRLEHDIPTTDPFVGYYLGSFGTFGPELLMLQRGLIDGEEAVIAHKVTGDPSVPAGHVSFHAKVGRLRGLAVPGPYPPLLDVSQRFRGQGCVMENASGSSWADGELLAFGGPNSGKFKRLTGNAELGFIWSMPRSKRFLILLSRVDFQ